jgi:hypothetical protein
MIYGFLQPFGGQVRIESEPGRGTTMHVVLPRTAGPPNTCLTRSRRMRVDAQTSGEVILLIEAEPPSARR